VSIQVGDRVKFRAGRGFAVGRVANSDGTIATIATCGGKLVNRKVDSLSKVEPEAAPQATEQESDPVDLVAIEGE